MFKKIQVLFGVTIGLMIASAIAWATTNLNNFTPGNVISSSQVNDNFSIINSRTEKKVFVLDMVPGSYTSGQLVGFTNRLGSSNSTVDDFSLESGFYEIDGIQNYTTSGSSYIYLNAYHDVFPGTIVGSLNITNDPTNTLKRYFNTAGTLEFKANSGFTLTTSNSAVIIIKKLD